MAETLIAGRYRLDELLGRGGMSEVWAATDTELGRRVALKLLAPHADTARFEREARAVASLGHPNITQLYDYGEEEGRPFMVLEYLPGGTLEEHLRAGRPLPDEDTRRISAELAAGLAHAHARGVVHRDLKPANVLFDEEGRAKLADFGIARMAAGEGTLTEAGTVLGSAAYISPEQAAGAPASAASDVYSFGVMLYRMLTGRLPFESNDPMELVTLHRDAEPPPLTQFRDDAPALLESTATAALEKDPADRPADGAALLDALGVPAGFSSITTSTSRGFDDPGATSVLPVASSPRAQAPIRPPRRSRMPLAIAALIVLILAGGALAYEVTRPASGSTPSDTTPITLPKPTTIASTQPTTTAPPTTAPSTTQSTQQTTTQRQTTTQATRPATTVAPPPTTTALPTTTAAPTTTAPPPTTTAAPPTTTAPPATTAP
ncbi:MAG: serine/threonine protein kinase [Actinomycetia bacterium]|nr:serine/threonine protein kinase [Actinomycetes bacterium]